MPKKPKLSILTIHLGMGGTERFISSLLPRLIEDYDVTLVIFYNYVHFEIPKEVKLIFLKQNTQNIKSYFFKFIDFINLFIKYRRFINKEGIDVSFSLLAFPNFINSFLSITNKKIRTIISERCFPSLMYKDNRLQMLLAKVFFPLLYNRNDALFSNSIYINDDLRQTFGVKIPMKVIYNPVETDDNIRITSQSICKTRPLKIINAGTIFSTKNQQLIIEAMALSKNGDFQLTILGNGPLKDELQSLSNQLNLSQYLNIVGIVKDVTPYFLDGDCFVLSSDTEGFPNVLLEALSLGLPTISTNCFSGPLELLNDNHPVDIKKGEFYLAKYGILINIKDDIALHKALTYFREHPEERKRYSDSGFERAKDFNLSLIYSQVKNILLN